MKLTLRGLYATKPPVSRPVWVVLVGVLCLSLAACQVLPQTQVSVPIAYAAAESPAPLQVKGRLVPRDYVTLAAAQGGRIEQVMVAEGQRVTAGDLLVQFEGYEASVAEIAAARLELTLAEQDIDALYEVAGVELARVEVELAEAVREQAFAQDRYESLATPLPQEDVDQAYANLLLAEKQMDKAQHDLDKLLKRFNNKNSIIWRFINQRQFKLRIPLLEAELANRQRHFQDAQDRYHDMLDWPDPIDLALAESRLEKANADLKRLQDQRDELQNGPDADNLQLALARRNAAQSRLKAAQVALATTELRAPIDGMVVDLQAKPGEWLSVGWTAVVLADLRQWVVETEDLGETQVPALQPGQPVTLKVDALPDLEIEGQVDKVDLLYTEDDDEIFYTADIIPLEGDSRLRWGMTVRIELDQLASGD